MTPPAAAIDRFGVVGFNHRQLPARQRDCMLWRKALPLVARILPPAPIYGNT